jgi:hypothetical protein
MRNYLSDVSSPYGAPRRDGHPGEGRIYLRANGYDRGGAYWGHGQPLWYYESDAEPDFHAASRACMILEELHGPLRFFRR